MDELTSVQPCFAGWICRLKRFPSLLPYPPLSPEEDAASVLGTRWVRGRARRRPAGEAAAAAAAAAEASLHNGAPREGEGRRMQRGWKQEWWEHGRDKREAPWM